MSKLVVKGSTMPASSPAAISRLEEFDAALQAFPALDMPTDHVIHGSMYARTVYLPAGAVITGALIEVPTIVVVSGRVMVTNGDASFEVDGLRVIAGCKGRKQAFAAIGDTWLTMIFRTSATTVRDAEDEFTKDAARLLSRRDGQTNTVLITGE